MSNYGNRNYYDGSRNRYSGHKNVGPVRTSTTTSTTTEMLIEATTDAIITTVQEELIGFGGPGDSSAVAGGKDAAGSSAGGAGSGTGIMETVTAMINGDSNTMEKHMGDDDSEYGQEHQYIYLYLAGILAVLIIIGIVLFGVYLLYKRKGFHQVESMKLKNEQSHSVDMIPADKPAPATKTARPKDPLVKK